MAIQTATNLRVPRRANWRTFDPINAAGYETIIEGSHTLYQRLGQTVPGLYGDFRTTSTTYTTTTSTSDRDLDTWEGASRMFRDLDDSGTTSVRVEVRAWIADCSFRLNVTRRDSDGTETSLGSIELSNASATISESSGNLTLTESQVSESGNPANDRATIVYDVEFFWTEEDGSEALLETWHVSEFYDATALLP